MTKKIEPVTIYGNADVAQLLIVTPAAVGNYLSRHDDTPAPAYVATNGTRYWDTDGMAAWQAWQDNRTSKRTAANA